jgi:hypothetical protein
LESGGHLVLRTTSLVVLALGALATVAGCGSAISATGNLASTAGSSPESPYDPAALVLSAELQTVPPEQGFNLPDDATLLAVHYRASSAMDEVAGRWQAELLAEARVRSDHVGAVAVSSEQLDGSSVGRGAYVLSLHEPADVATNSAALTDLISNQLTKYGLRGTSVSLADEGELGYAPVVVATPAQDASAFVSAHPRAAMELFGGSADAAFLAITDSSGRAVEASGFSHSGGFYVFWTDPALGCLANCPIWYDDNRPSTDG